MSTEQQVTFKSPFVQKLAQLYQQHAGDLKAKGMMGMLLNVVKPEIPELLQALDQDDGMRGKIEAFVVELAGCAERK